MGWFEDSPEEIREKEIKQKTEMIKRQIKEKGLLNMIDEKDFEKVAILQRDCMIALLSQVVIANSGLVGDAIAISTQSLYYSGLTTLVKDGKQ